MNEWDNYGPRERGRDSGDVVVTVPNIVNEGSSPGKGRETVSLKQAADYIIAEMERRRGGWEGGRDWPYEPSGPTQPAPGNGPYYPGGWEREGDIGYRANGLAAGIPLTAIGNVRFDGMYTLTAGLVCKTADAGATSLVLTVTYVDAVAGPTTETVTLVLTATGKQSEGPIVVFLLGASSVTVTSVLTGAFGAATYNAYVQLEKVS